MLDFYQWLRETTTPVQDQIPQPKVYQFDMEPKEALPDETHTNDAAVYARTMWTCARLLISLLKKAGYEAYFAGGAIRSALSSEHVKDYDIATNADATTVLQVLGNASIPAQKTGDSFPVVRGSFPSPTPWSQNKKLQKPIGIEIATYRVDVDDNSATATAHRHIDAQRRDITYNSMYYDPFAKEIHDYTGGYEDLLAGKTRMVGKAMDRFTEDPLRVLRFVRFHNTIKKKDYDPEKDPPPGSYDTIDDEHKQAIARFVQNGLRYRNGQKTPPERINDEFIKGLGQAKSMETYLDTYQKTGLLNGYVFPNATVDLTKVFPVDRQVLQENDNLLIPLYASILRDNKPQDVQNMLWKQKNPSNVANGVAFLLAITPGFGNQASNVNLDRETMEQNPQGFIKILQKYTKKASGNLEHGQVQMSPTQRDIPPDVMMAWAQYANMDTELVNAFVRYRWKSSSEIIQKYPNISRRLGFDNSSVEGAALGELERLGNLYLFKQSLGS